MSRLKAITQGRKLPPRMVLYGPPKIGKSTFGAESERPIFVPTEDGIDNVTVDRFPRVNTWADLVANLESVASDEHEYQTLVLDTLNGAAELASQHVCETKFGGDFGPKGYSSFGQGIAATSEEMRRLLPILDRCRERGLMVLLLAHTGIQSVKNPIDGDYQKFTPDVDRRVWARFAAWADIIARVEFEHTVVRRGEGSGKAVGSSTRVVRFTGSAAEDAGCRVGFDLPDRLPLSFQAFRDALGDSSETTSEVAQLWSLLSPEEVKKTLAWLGVADLQHATPAKLRQLLNRLRQKAADQAQKEEPDAS